MLWREHAKVKKESSLEKDRRQKLHIARTPERSTR